MSKSAEKILKIVIISFFVILFVIGAARQVKADEVKLGLGKGAFNTSVITQDIGYERNYWYGQFTRIGNDARLPSDLWRVSLGYKSYWRKGFRIRPYLGLGAAYFTKAPRYVISERLAFDMKVGARFYDIVELEFQHNSTAGRSDINWGLDVVTFRVVVPIGED